MTPSEDLANAMALGWLAIFLFAWISLIGFIQALLFRRDRRLYIGGGIIFTIAGVVTYALLWLAEHHLFGLDG